MKMVVITVDELVEIVKTNVREALAEQAQATVTSPKHADVDDASDHTGIPKATIYQLTSKRKIPHRKMGKRLVFDIQELDAWILSKKRKTIQEIEAEASTLPTKKGGRRS